MPGVEEGVEALTDSLGTAMSTTTFLSQERRPPAPESSTQLSRRDLARTSTPPAPPAARSTRRRTGRTAGRGERGGAMEVAAVEEASSGAEGSGLGTQEWAADSATASLSLSLSLSLFLSKKQLGTERTGG